MRVGSRLKVFTAAVAVLVASVVAACASAVAGSPPRALDTLAVHLADRIGGPDARLLLLGITDRDGASSDLERYLTDKVAAALSATGRVRLTDEAARRSARAEIRENLADVIDPATVQQAGRLAGAAWLLKGTAYVFPDARRAELALQLIRTETGEYWQALADLAVDPTLLALRSRNVDRPREALRRPPLSLEMVAVASRPDGTGRDIDLGVVQDASRLRSNDDLKLYFRTNADAYVYLVWVDPLGKATLQYPSAKAGTDNRTRGGNVHTAPAGDIWYYLDGQRGHETLYLVASYEPLANLDALLRQAEQDELRAAAGDARRELERLFDDLQTRGAAGVRPGPAIAVTAKSGASTVNADTTLVRGYGHAIRRLTFRHDP